MVVIVTTPAALIVKKPSLLVDVPLSLNRKPVTPTASVAATVPMVALADWFSA